MSTTEIAKNEASLRTLKEAIDQYLSDIDTKKYLKNRHKLILVNENTILTNKDHVYHLKDHAPHQTTTDSDKPYDVFENRKKALGEYIKSMFNEFENGKLENSILFMNEASLYSYLFGESDTFKALLVGFGETEMPMNIKVKTPWVSELNQSSIPYKN